MAERLYSTQQVATLLGATPQTVCGWIQAGWLPGERLPGGDVRVSETGLVRFLRGRGVDLRAVLAAATAAEAEDVPAADPPPPARPQAPPPPSDAGPAAAAGRETPSPPAVDVVGRLAEAILGDAVRRRAEAIHLEPLADGLTMRLRVNGHLREKPNFRSRLPRSIGPQLTGRLASMAGADNGNVRRGSFDVTLDGKPTRFHLAACPTAHGTRLTIRPALEPLALEDLGLLARDLRTLRQVLGQSSGLVLVTGPPRSGRTTTLRAMLAEAEGATRTVLAAVDGDDADWDGVEHLAAGGPGGPALAAAIAAASGQRVDVLAVDEIRDADAAAAAVRAALDGHLVLAAAPARDPWPDPALLVSRGVDAFALASTLLAVVCQRTVRTLCPHCKRPGQADAAAMEALGAGPDCQGDVATAGPGCPRCYDRGYDGRTGLLSVLRVDEPLAALMRQGVPGRALHALAREGGLTTLREAGLEKVRAQVTSPEEVVRATLIV
ncbi:MAG TPA: ATPase, T2SS/T4P/T4SS family [Phycisphaerae bacterium]|nr:ATPase, T2SS/T4P/T4SS family [Phycisphaerae bacterium]